MKSKFERHRQRHLWFCTGCIYTAHTSEFIDTAHIPGYIYTEHLSAHISVQRTHLRTYLDLSIQRTYLRTHLDLSIQRTHLRTRLYSAHLCEHIWMYYTARILGTSFSAAVHL